VFSSPKTKNTLDKSSMGVVYLSLQISIVLTATQTCYADRPTAEIKGYNLASDFIPLDIHKYSEKTKEKMLAICSYST
jgi:hypothetical protein